MGDYEEYGDDWGYNGDSEHDMWVDYTTDMYEDTDYSGENRDCDMDWDAEYKANVHHHNGGAQYYEHSIHQMEGLIAAALASAAILDTKSANASSAKNIRKYQRRAIEKQSEAKRYQAELDKLKRNYETAKLESEKARTWTITVICAIVSFIAIIIAILY